MIYLRDDLKAAWKNQDPFQLLENMDGEVFRELEARRTFRFKLNDSYFFAKVHLGVGWGEILGDLLRFRKPVLGARNEWNALNKLKELGVDTMSAVGFGELGKNPASQRSFLVTEELADMQTLEDVCEQWPDSPPDFVTKQAVISKLAEISRILHENGVNHRDYYLCHFMVPRGPLDKDNLNFYLIDLHRAQIRSQLPDRWRIKDLSGLYYSCMDIGLTKRDILRFLRQYADAPLREVMSSSYWQALCQNTKQKALKLYARMERKAGHPNY